MTIQDICTPGYSKKVRTVPAGLKRQVYARYGICTSAANELVHGGRRYHLDCRNLPATHYPGSQLPGQLESSDLPNLAGSGGPMRLLRRIL